MRPKKDGELVNAKLERSLADQFNKYVEEPRFPKTVVVEKTLQEYLDRHTPLDGDKSE